MHRCRKMMGSRGLASCQHLHRSQLDAEIDLNYCEWSSGQGNQTSDRKQELPYPLKLEQAVSETLACNHLRIMSSADVKSCNCNRSAQNTLRTSGGPIRQRRAAARMTWRGGSTELPHGTGSVRSSKAAVSVTRRSMLDLILPWVRHTGNSRSGAYASHAK